MTTYYQQVAVPVLIIISIGLLGLVLTHKKLPAVKQLVCGSTLLGVLLIGSVPFLPVTARPWLPIPQAKPESTLVGFQLNNVSQRPDLMSIGMLIAATVSLVLAFRLVMSLLAAARLRRCAKPASSRICQMADSDVRVVPSLSSPVALGGFNPIILLPAEAEDWTEDQLRAVLIHEQAHLSNGDPNWQLLAEFVCLLHWFNPFIWWIRSTMRREAEKTADSVVIQAGIQPSIYAKTLVDFARTMGHDRHSFAWTAFARQGGIESRIHAILTPHSNRKPMKKSMKITAVVGIMLAAYVTSAFTFQNKESVKQVEPIKVAGVPLDSAKLQGERFRAKLEVGGQAMEGEVLNIRKTEDGGAELWVGTTEDGQRVTGTFSEPAKRIDGKPIDLGKVKAADGKVIEVQGRPLNDIPPQGK